MNKISASEGIFYFFFYGLALLFMPFASFIARGILSLVIFPILLVTQNSAGANPGYIDSISNYYFQSTLIIVGIGIFFLYFILTKKMIKNNSGARVGLFAVFFISSSVINFFFSYFICAISVLKRCDPTRYFTFFGFLEIFYFYIIGLAAFVAVNVYLRYTLRQVKL